MRKLCGTFEKRAPVPRIRKWSIINWDIAGMVPKGMCLLYRESWTQRTTSNQNSRKNHQLRSLARPCRHMPCVRGRPHWISLTSSRISTSIACWNVSCALMSPVMSSSRVTEPDTKRNNSRLYTQTKNVNDFHRLWWSPLEGGGGGGG